MSPRNALIALCLSLLVGSGIWLMVSPSAPDAADRQPLFSGGESPIQDLAEQPAAREPVVEGQFTRRLVVGSTDQAGELIQKMECFERGDCDADSTDSRADHQRQAQAIAGQLSQLDASQSGARELALRALQLPNGHVQRAALDVIMQQAPEAQTTEAVASAIANGHDAPLFEHAAEWLAAAVAAGHAAPVEQMLGESLVSGSPYLAQSMADQILRFLTEENLALFADLQQQLPPHSQRALRLRQALHEFDLRRSGG